MDQSVKDRNPRVIKIAQDGALTLSLPESAGQYLIIQEQEGRIILEPYDLRWRTPDTMIAEVGGRLHVGPQFGGRTPEA